MSMEAGKDGRTDHHGEDLPELSKSATKMDYERLLSAPLPRFKGNYPGSPLWMEVGYFCLRRTFSNIFRTFEVTGDEKIPTDRGTLCAAWHTNGLLDPISILLTHPKKFVVGGRHDLVTRPLFGWWARKFAAQPVVRKAELLRGGCSEEEATHLNGRSLLNLATGISAGFGCALFPEGTSHSESHLIRLRTGPMRTVLAAVAIAKAQDFKSPQMIPIGLHYRVRHLYRTDAWVEYGDPITIPDEGLPQDLIEAVSEGNWAEPPAQNVTTLRDALEIKLAPMTPDSPSFGDYRADHLVAHMRARKEQTPLTTWREEVLAAREVKAKPPSEDAAKLAKNIGNVLYDNHLDGRDISPDGRRLRSVSPLGAIIDLAKLALFLTFLPITIISLSLQILLGRYLGDSTDEGMDARTTYQFLAGMFGSLIFWPIIGVTSVLIASSFHSEIHLMIGVDWTTMLGEDETMKVISHILAFIASLILFLISANTFSYGWDVYVDIRKFTSRQRIGQKISPKLEKLLSLLE